MRQLVRCVAVLVTLLGAAASAVAATPSDFYLNLLRRGVVAFDAEKYADASNHLRLAAFGLVDSVEHYQTAHIYLALTYDRLQAAEKARSSVRRVIAAERIERKYGALTIPAGVASSFDALARKLLTASEVAMLSRTPTAKPPATETQKQPAPAPAQRTIPAPAAGTNNQGSQHNNTNTEKPPVIKAPETKQPAVENLPAEKLPDKTVEKPAVEKPPVEKPKPQPPPPPAPKPQTSAITVAPSPNQDIPTRLAAGERALNTSQLPEARRIYRGLLDAPGITRETLMRVAEGLYRSRDFDGALAAFAKVGALRRGEEPYHYYIAVAYYESGRYKEAKQSLAAALPYIEVTPDVARYREKIEGAID